MEKDQLALNIRAGSQPSLDPGQFDFSAQVRSGKSPAELEKALYEELEKLAKEGVPAEELEKARNQTLANLYRQLKTISGKANLLGTYQVFYGDWNMVNKAASELEKVTPSDIQRVAAKYFTEKNRTVATLIPETKGSAR